MSIDLEPISQICHQHTTSRSSLVMLLQETQKRYGYLPREALKAISRELKVPLARLYGLATFYRSFSLTPRGKHEITVCTGTACHVRGGNSLLDHLERNLGIGAGSTTADGLFTLVSVNCLGACAIGPILVMDGKYHGNMTPDKADSLVQAVRQKAGGKTLE